MLVYMIRHGQTDWNAEGRLQGQKDIPLNETGRRQASGNGLALKEILGAAASDFDYVASPLGRTRETMELVRAEMGLDPLAYRTDERLVEVCFGDWEGFTISELKQTVRDKVKARARSKWDFIPPGENAESYEILSWRVGSWFNNIERPTVCVSHGGVFRALFKFAGMPLIDAANAAIHQDRILRVDDAGAAWL